jgi:hypothetical protein
MHPAIFIFFRGFDVSEIAPAVNRIEWREKRNEYPVISQASTARDWDLGARGWNEGAARQLLTIW